MIKPPNVSGQFYSANPIELSSHIDQLFHQVKDVPQVGHVDIVIAPHAGYIFSGGIAAYGFKAISQESYSTVIVLAPSHYYGFDGISIWSEGGFETPLGVVPVDQDMTKRLIGQDEKFVFDPNVFEKEHALEVEIPFLQKALHGFQLVPVIIGQPSYDTLSRFAQALHGVIGERQDVLIVVSTDLSHYHDDATARALDDQAVEAIKELAAERIYRECKTRKMEMCGCMPVVAALVYANLSGANNVDVLRYGNSGDINGDKNRVVGYTSILIHGQKENSTTAFGEQAVPLSTPQKKKLIDIARNSICEYVNNQSVKNVVENDPRLQEEEGAFVTIKRQGHLRGCIGNVLGRGPLYRTVRDMAIAAASQDPRFPPMAAQELADMDVEVSVLSKPWRIKSVDEIILGVHGVIVRKGAHHQGLFLPQVATETGWGKEKFMMELCSQKAGLSPNCWQDPETVIEIFTADVFSEHDVGPK